MAAIEAFNQFKNEHTDLLDSPEAIKECVELYLAMKGDSTRRLKFFIFNHYILLGAILPFYSMPSINHSWNSAMLPRKMLPRKKLTNICIFCLPSYVPKFSFLSLLLHMYYRYHMTTTTVAGTGTLVQNDHDDDEQSSQLVMTVTNSSCCILTYLFLWFTYAFLSLCLWTVLFLLLA